MLRNTRSKGKKVTKTPSNRKPAKSTGKASSPKSMQEAHVCRFKK